MDATVFIPRQFHRALAALGKQAWWRLLPVPGNPHAHNLYLDTPAAQRALDSLPTGPDHRTLAYLLRGLGAQFAGEPDPAMEAAVATLHGGVQAQGAYFESLILLSRMLADGPKIFRPTYAQCEAMSQVEVGITIGDYRQAYPVVVIEAPAAWAKARGCSRYMAVHHSERDAAIITVNGNLAGTGDSDTFITTSMTGAEQIIEPKLSRVGADQVPDRGGVDFERNLHILRVAMNCNLLLTMYRVRSAPADPKQAAKLAQWRKSPSRERRERAATLGAGEFDVLTFAQDVRFHDEEHAPAPGLPLPAAPYPGGPLPQPADGRHMPPHWRKGHWRRQWTGPMAAERQRKLVFIKPVLVRRDLFAGDPGATEVVYR